MRSHIRIIIALLIGMGVKAVACELRPLPLQTMTGVDGKTATLGDQTFAFIYDAKTDAFIPQFDNGTHACHGAAILGDPFHEQKTLWFDAARHTVVVDDTYGSGDSDVFVMDSRTCAVRKKVECQGDVAISADKIHCGPLCEVSGDKKDCSAARDYSLSDACGI